MLRKLRERITYANVVSTLALFIAVGGGTAFAVVAANQVDSTSIINGQVKNQDLAADAVGPGKVLDGSLDFRDIKPSGIGGGRIADNSVTGADVNESTLGPVGRANDANTVNGARIARIDYRESHAAAGTGQQRLIFGDTDQVQLMVRCNTRTISASETQLLIELYSSIGGVYNGYWTDRSNLAPEGGVIPAKSSKVLFGAGPSALNGESTAYEGQLIFRGDDRVVTIPFHAFVQDRTTGKGYCEFNGTGTTATQPSGVYP